MKPLVACAYRILVLVPILNAQQEAAMTARGTFDVTVTPFAPDAGSESAIGRLALSKQFHGDLEARSQGQMLGAQTPVEGSAGYVAMEVVTGTLNGRRGSFILQHMGSMTKGAPKLEVVVVPDSGTDQLAGLAGKVTIIIEGSAHSYEFDYTLADSGP